MPFISNLLHLAILSTLSIAALGQNDTLTSECVNALTNFTQDSVCFGSEEGLTGFVAALNSAAGSITNPMEGLNDPAVLQAIMTFYDNLCSSQDCVNSYADVIDICLGSTLAQLNLDVTLLVDQVVDYSCATNEAGQYCAIAQLENITDFITVILCSLNLNTLPNATDVSCANTCDAVRRARSSIGCCINNYLEFVESIFNATSIIPGASYRFPDYSGIFTDCGIADPGTCTTTLSNPMRPSITQPPRIAQPTSTAQPKSTAQPSDSTQPPRNTQLPRTSAGYPAVHSWGLLAALMVTVKVTLNVIF